MSAAAEPRMAPINFPREFLDEIERAVMNRSGQSRGNEIRFRCPLDGHEDKNPDASWNTEKHTWTCYVCGKGGGALDLADRLGIDKPERRNGPTLKAVPPPNLTLAEYAAAKGLPESFLRSIGCADAPYLGGNAVRMVYPNRNGSESSVRFRISMKKTPNRDRFLWQKGSTAHPYGLNRIPDAERAGYIVLQEGESCTQTLWYRGFTALGIPGAATWKDERDTPYLDNIPLIYAVVEPDGGGDTFRAKLLASPSLRDRLYFIDLSPYGVKDVSDLYLDDPDTFDERMEDAIAAATPATEWATPDPPGDKMPQLELEDFYAYLPKHKYIFRRDGSIWDPAGVNAGLPPVSNGFAEIPAGKYLDRTRAVHQMTWIPGQPEVIVDALVTAGGLASAPGKRAYNRYRPPEVLPGDATKAGPWLDHIERLYPDDATHIVSWFAHRVQRPGEKINHALVLGGTQGIGKDTMLDPVVRAVGPNNVADESPATVTGRFNKFLASVILRVSEARDLGDVDRYGFYEHMKAILAAPPDVLSVEMKFVDAYPVPNVVGVIFTTNNRHNGLYLPAEDRRHYVAWSELTTGDFEDDYFGDLYDWYEAGGYGHVIAYLHARDLRDFKPKAPPLKTDAFWAMVDTGRSPEEGELRDLLDTLRNPEAVTVDTLRSKADPNGELWDLFNERKLRTQVPHRMADIGYIPVRNPYAKDGLWVIGGKRKAIYALATLSKRDRITAAGRLT